MRRVLRFRYTALPFRGSVSPFLLSKQTAVRLPYILLIVALTLNAAANLCLKHSANLAGTGASLADKLFSPSGLWMGLDLGLFAANVIVYRLALEGVDVSVGYPIMVGGGLLIISGVAILVFGESISWKLLVGYLLLVAGLVFVSLHISEQAAHAKGRGLHHGDTEGTETTRRLG